MTDKTLDVLYGSYTEKVKEAKTAQAAADEIKSEIRQELEARGITQHNGTGWRAIISEVTSSRLDTAALKKEHGKIYQKYLKESHSTRFLLNKVED